MTMLGRAALVAGLALAAGCGRTPPPPAPEPAPVAKPAPAPVPAITEAEARSVVEAFEAASAEFDIYAMSLQLAEDAKLVAYPPKGMGPTLKIQGRERITDQLRSAQKLMEMKNYTSQVGAITPLSDGTVKATVTATSEYMVQRNRFVQAGEDVFVIARRKGEPKIVSYTSTTTGVTVNGQKQY